VVILHTFAWNRGPCLRRGIPLSVALQQAKAAEDLAVISITTPAMPVDSLRLGEKQDMTQSTAVANPMGQTCPYLDAPNGFTYMWAVGRNEELVWEDKGYQVPPVTVENSGRA